MACLQAEAGKLAWQAGPQHPPVQTRTVTCYDSSGNELAPADCSTLAPPASQQPCSSCVPANSSSAGAAGGSPGSGGSSSSGIITVVACVAGGVLALAAAAGAFVVVLRRRRQQVAAAAQQPAGPGQGQPAGKWGSEHDCIPLPKTLPPIATGRGGQRAAPGSGPQFLEAAAGTMAAAQLQQHQRLHQLAPDYHVVHMPSPRLPGGQGPLNSGAAAAFVQ